MSWNRVDRIGQRHGRLLVVAFIGRRGEKAYWLCRCDCGSTKEVQGGNLASGDVSSCGCYRKSLRPRLKHGEGVVGKQSAEYRTWIRMIVRCYNKKGNRWHRYGGRGIRVCHRWRHDFEAFLTDMGRRPSPQHSLDRYPDPDGDYRPDNCRWATSSEQRRNHSKRAAA